MFVESLDLRAANALAVAETVKKGLSYRKFEVFRARTQMSTERIAKTAHIPKRTLARRKRTGRFTTEESERLLRLGLIYDLTLHLFERNVTAARQWLERPNPTLDDRSPLEVAETEVGGREVEGLIGRLELGVYS